MTPNPVIIQEDDDIGRVAELMNPEKFRHLPVVNAQQEVVGMISDRDLRNIQTALDFVQNVLGEGTSKLKVKDIMHQTVISVAPQQSLKEAALLLVENKIGALPVVAERKLVGILSYTDILRAFAEHAHQLG